MIASGWRIFAAGYVFLVLVCVCLYQRIQLGDARSNAAQCAYQIKSLQERSAEQSKKYTQAQKDAEKEIKLYQLEVDDIKNYKIPPGDCEKAVRFGIDYAKKFKNG